MKVIGISGSIVGSRTRVAVTYTLNKIKEKRPDLEVELVDLASFKTDFSDGRDFRDYNGDTRTLIEKVMTADAYIIGSPTYQSSIPGVLKNVFDLLPVDSFKDKVIGIISTAGSEKHYLVAEYQLKPILHYMKAVVVQKYVFVEEKHFHNGQIVADDIAYRLDQLAQDTLDAIVATELLLKSKDDAYDF
ncbi:NADPH-dependent FMN reductase [Sphingobacterium anhuiense]|uniref:NADPH-dependent FMN reductase n=1 Tax=Sphingobacterium anhuiense TaxID=493780 RepID=UPI003C2F83AD